MDDKLLKRYFLVEFDMVERETAASSNPGDRTTHEGFRQIVRKGWPMVPFILEKLRSGRAGPWWMEALHQITGEDPIEKYGARYRDADGYASPGLCLFCWEKWAMARVLRKKFFHGRGIDGNFSTRVGGIAADQ